MDPRALHTTVNELVRLTRKRPDLRVDTRRHALYLPVAGLPPAEVLQDFYYAADLDANEPAATPRHNHSAAQAFAAEYRERCVDKDEEGDDKSTWEFRTPDVPLAQCASTASAPSEAQVIAARYRAGLPVEPCTPSPGASTPALSLSASVSVLSPGASTSSSSYATNTSSSYAKQPPLHGISPDTTLSVLDISPANSLVAFPTIPVETPTPANDTFAQKARFRKSRADALQDIRTEALDAMLLANVGPSDPLTCPRPNCDDTLRDMKALTYHLHIHSMHDRVFKCTACGGRFETSHELGLHRCVPLPTSPLLEGFRRVFKISQLSLRS